MAPRTPASPEQIVEVLNRWQPVEAEPRLVPKMYAITEVQKQLRTTRARATEWIENARQAGALYQVGTTEYGSVSVLMPRTDGKPGNWYGRPAEVPGLLDSVGVTRRDLRDVDWMIKVDQYGVFTRDDDAQHYEGIWLATPAVMTHLVQQAQRALDAYRVGRATEEILTDATMTHVHADAVDRIRGLLDAAELLRPPTKREIDRGMAHFDSRVVERFGTDKHTTAVTITLYGEAIDKLGDVLRTLGVPMKKAEDGG